MLQRWIRLMAALIGVALISAISIGCTASSPKLTAVLWIGGFAHDFDSAAEILTDSLEARIPIEIEVVRDASFLSFLDSDVEKPLDVILMHHCYKSAEGVLTEPQKRKLLELVRGGVGVVGIHASYYSFPEWDEYHELYGARFIKHGASEAVLTVRRVDKQHPIMKELADSFEVVSELYESTPLAKDCRVLARAKERGGAQEHPSVWTRLYGKGRIVTILPAHWPDSYGVAGFQKLIASSTLWAAGRLNATENTHKERDR